jgi:adenosylcobyric acid synthase
MPVPMVRRLAGAQALQAMAAGLEPRADMNPVLLKTEADSRSQVVVMGKPWLTLEGRDYLSLRAEVWPKVCGAMDRMCADFDLVIAEGAGSPAEINLNDREIVNMSVARYLDAPVILAADIDRGGVFASLVGTLALLDDGDAQRVRGFLINKFRGDVSLLGNGLEMLSERTAGRPTLGVIPWIHGLRLAQEDSVAMEGLGGLGNWRRTGGEGDVDIAVPRFPRMANFDDLDALAMEEGVGIRFVESPSELGRPAAVLLPGSKTTIRDLEWLRNAGLAERIRDLTDSGVPVVGICGGFQMMGRDIVDETGIEGPPGRSDGLGILNVRTVFEAVKRTRPVQARVSGEAAGGGRGTAAGAPVRGYEIHMGRNQSGYRCQASF